MHVNVMAGLIAILYFNNIITFENATGDWEKGVCLCVFVLINIVPVQPL